MTSAIVFRGMIVVKGAARVGEVNLLTPHRLHRHAALRGYGSGHGEHRSGGEAPTISADGAHQALSGALDRALGGNAKGPGRP